MVIIFHNEAKLDKKFVSSRAHFEFYSQNGLYNVKQHLFEKGSRPSDQWSGGPEHQEGDRP